MDVLCIGLMVCDVIIKPIDLSVFQRDSIRLETLKIASGGDALNASINLAKLGIHVGLVGKVGNDALGKYLIGEADCFGVNTGAVLKAEDCATSTSIVLLEESGERHFAYYGKANDSLVEQDIPVNLLESAGIVHIGSAMALESLDGSGAAKLFQRTKSLGKTTSMDVTWDSSGRWLKKIEETLHYTDIFMPSYNEAQLITGLKQPEQMRGFFQKYGLGILVVKLGAEGCYVTDFNNEYYIKTFKSVKAVDTTGAGDAFVAGFLTGIIKGWDLYECGVLGNATASNCVMEFGATTGTKSLEATMKFIKSNPDVKLGSGICEAERQ